MRARLPVSQPDMLSTTASTESGGEDKENGDTASVNESVNVSEEQALSTTVASICRESSTGNDEGVRTRQINEGTNGSMR